MRTILAAAVIAIIATGTAFAQDIGVAACDDFLKKYDTCIVAKVPADQRGKLNTTLEQVRTNWKAVAQTQEGKTELNNVCTQTANTIKQQSTSLGCAW